MTQAAIGTLARGLHLLACIAAAGRPLGVTELAHLADLDKATTFRLARTLARLGYLEQDRGTRQFHLGLRVLDLGFAYLASLDVRRCALPDMRRLQEQFDGTISLSVLSGTDVVYLERLPPRRLQASAPVGVGARLPVHCTSMGKVILACLPEPEAEDLLSRLPMTAWTPLTITDPSVLRHEVDQVRAQGYALSEQETVLGLRSAAAPIRNRDGAPAAALSVALGVQDVTREELRDLVAPKVVEAAANVSQHLGYRAAPARPAA